MEVENYVQILKSLWSFTPLSMYNFAVLLRCTYRLKCFNFVSILYLDSRIYFNHGIDRTQHSLISANCVLCVLQNIVEFQRNGLSLSSYFHLITIPFDPRAWYLEEANFAYLQGHSKFFKTGNGWNKFAWLF